jgi:hypothetical protein
VDRERLWWSAHGEQRGRRRRTRMATVDFEARCEMRVQERAKWREGEPLNILDQQEGQGRHARALATTVARWRPGRARAEAGRRGAHGRGLEEGK